jgi:hypothetical protein
VASSNGRAIGELHTEVVRTPQSGAASEATAGGVSINSKDSSEGAFACFSDILRENLGGKEVKSSYSYDFGGGLFRFKF